MNTVEFWDILDLKIRRVLEPVLLASAKRLAAARIVNWVPDYVRKPNFLGSGSLVIRFLDGEEASVSIPFPEWAPNFQLRFAESSAPSIFPSDLGIALSGPILNELGQLAKEAEEELRRCKTIPMNGNFLNFEGFSPGPFPDLGSDDRKAIAFALRRPCPPNSIPEATDEETSRWIKDMIAKAVQEWRKECAAELPPKAEGKNMKKPASKKGKDPAAFLERMIPALAKKGISGQVSGNAIHIPTIGISLVAIRAETDKDGNLKKASVSQTSPPPGKFHLKREEDLDPEDFDGIASFVGTFLADFLEGGVWTRGMGKREWVFSETVGKREFRIFAKWFSGGGDWFVVMNWKPVASEISCRQEISHFDVAVPAEGTSAVKTAARLALMISEPYRMA